MADKWERRETPYKDYKIEKLVNKQEYKPVNIWDALMRGIDADPDDDFSSFDELREVVIDAVESLSPKDRICINAIYAERITYEELGHRLGYKPQKSGSPQAYYATQRALERLKEVLLRSPVIAEHFGSATDAD
jgi:DNA-directed RNA polymerase specialized sigma24 family protein